MPTLSRKNMPRATAKPDNSACHEYDPSSAPQFVGRMSSCAPQLVPGKAGLIPAPPPQSSLNMPSMVKYETEKFFEPKVEDLGPVKNIKQSTSRRRTRILIGVGICTLLAIIVAVVGGVLGSRKAHPEVTSSSISSSATKTTSAGPTNTGFQAPGGPNPSTINDAWAYNGTSVAAVTFSTTSDTTGTNYLVFYQHSNGEIRQTVYNNSVWHNSQLVTTDAHPGTPLSVYWKGNDFQLYLFYFDKNKVLQELRGKHGSNLWLNGTLGSLSLQSDTPSSLTVQYPGACLGVETAWAVYHTGIGSKAQAVYWNGNTDTWALRETFEDLKPGAGFAGHNNVGIWRLYYTSNKSNQLKELVCSDCCTNSSSTGWKDGLNGPNLGSSTGGIAAINVGLPRLVYYPVSIEGGINELNNSLQYPHEVWMDNVSSSGIQNGGNTGVEANPTANIGPPGMSVARGIPGGQVAIAAGFRGSLQEVWLFYQANGTDVSVQVRDADAAGDWSSPQSIPVSR